MDGGGGLDQPLTRSRQSVAGQGGTPADEPSAARIRRRASRFAWFDGYGRSGARWGARIAQLPRGAGIAASMLLIAAALGYGAVKGQHLAAVTDWLKDTRNVAANSLGFRIAAVSRRRRGTGTADGESVDRRRGRSETLPGPPADHDHRAGRLCALAEG